MPSGGTLVSITSGPPAAGGAAAAGTSPSCAIEMIGVPTGTVSPSGTSSAVTVPA